MRALSLASELLSAEKRSLFVGGGSSEDDEFLEVGLISEKSAAVEEEVEIGREGLQRRRRRFEEKKKKEDRGAASIELEARRAGGERTWARARLLRSFLFFFFHNKPFEFLQILGWE